MTIRTLEILILVGVFTWFVWRYIARVDLESWREAEERIERGERERGEVPWYERETRTEYSARLKSDPEVNAAQRLILLARDSLRRSLLRGGKR